MTEPLAPSAFFTATLRPHRSATVRGINVVIGLIAVISFGAGIAFVSMGAWPVTGFLGLDILLLWFALRLNHHAGNARETVEIDADTIRVLRVDSWGRRHTRSFPTYWAQAVVDEDRKAVVLRSHGEEFAIGRFLTEAERMELGQALREALRRARRTDDARPALS